VALVSQARGMGIEINIRTQSMVNDVAIAGEKIKLTVIDSHKTTSQHLFDYVILATGHLSMSRMLER
jgi:uncharacterized FAD-dependent dehydrogenase